MESAARPPASAGLRGCAAALVALCAAGCASVGPPTIARDRVDYDHAVTTSWKRTMLLNMVKLRYGDTPMFLDVSSIINSYTVEGAGTAGAAWPSGGGPAAFSFSGNAHYADKPTITYNPLLGERFTRSLMTPLQPAVVVSLIQSGWPADAVMNMMVTSANGVYNRFGGSSRTRGADAAWPVITQAMRRIQASAAVGLRIESDAGAGRDLSVLVLHRNDETPQLRADVRTLRDALGIRQDAREIRVVYGSFPKTDAELALVTRSMLEILIDLASAIEAPDADVALGIVPAPARFDTDTATGYKPLIRIRSAEAPPEQAFVAVPYHGHWFWIDERDYASKSVFSFVLVVFSLMDTAPKGQPLMTVPVN